MRKATAAMKCKILMSFAMANHGSTFAHWLRNELMRQFGLYELEAVYVDSIVARNIDDSATIKQDTRVHMRSPTGAMPIGAMRPDWNTLYQQAMSMASVMLFCSTQEFLQSEWCLQEWEQFRQARRERAAQSPERPLRAVILEFTPFTFDGAGIDGVTRVPVAKRDGGRRGLAWDVGDYILSQEDLRKVYRAIGPLPT
jgi:hypothetical protein